MDNLHSEIYNAKAAGLLSIKNEKLFIALSTKGQFCCSKGFEDSRYYGMNILTLKYNNHDLIPTPPAIPSPDDKIVDTYLCGFLPAVFIGRKSYTVPVYENIVTLFNHKFYCIFGDGELARLNFNKFLKLVSNRRQPYVLEKLEDCNFKRAMLIFPLEPVVVFIDMLDGRKLNSRTLRKTRGNIFYRSFTDKVNIYDNKLSVEHDGSRVWFENIYPSYKIKKIIPLKIYTSKGVGYTLYDNNKINEDRGFINIIKAIYCEGVEREAPKFFVKIQYPAIELKIITKLDTYHIYLDFEKQSIN